MTPKDFRDVGQALFPIEYWQAEMSKLLGVSPRTIYRWADDSEPQELSDEKYKPALLAYAKDRKTELDNIVYKLKGYKDE